MSPVAKAAPAPKATAAVVGLDDETRIARLHLRLGMLVLARSELEDLERRGLLDTAGRASLAEARWRSGDTEMASTAARAHLDAGGEDPVAICIAAEAAAADGRPGEARTLMDRLGPPDAATLDALFAGIARRAFWPSASGEPMTEDTLFGDATYGTVGGAPAGDARSLDQRGRFAALRRPAAEPTGAPAADRQIVPTRAVPGPRQVIEATEPGLWGDVPAAPPPAGEPEGRTAPSLDIDPLAELATAREELSEAPDRALLRMALVLRIDPTLAPAVLDAISLRREPAAAMIRGDAQRLLGRHLEAEAAFAAAAEGLDRGIVRKPS
jgi:hypothetical protein